MFRGGFVKQINWMCVLQLKGIKEYYKCSAAGCGCHVCLPPLGDSQLSTQAGVDGLK